MREGMKSLGPRMAHETATTTSCPRATAFQTLVLDPRLGDGVRQVPAEGIEGIVLVARPIGVVADRAERAGDHHAADARLPRGLEHVAGAHHVGVVELALGALERRDLGGGVIDALHAPGRGAHGVEVAQIAVGALDREAGDGALVGAGHGACGGAPIVRAEEHAHLVSVGEEAAHEVRAQVAGGAGDEVLHGKRYSGVVTVDLLSERDAVVHWMARLTGVRRG
jgi:hypothetical protein